MTQAQQAERLTRDQQKDRTREEIRNAALDLFEERGFDGTTIDDIVSKSGIGRRTFFRYFSCKEAILFTTGVFPNFETDLKSELERGSSPIRAVVTAIERDACGSESPDESTIRRRKMRRELLSHPSVNDFYRVQISMMADTVTEIVRTDPKCAEVRFLPELVGGLLQIMTLEHLSSGETHHFSVDESAWRTALRALERGFDE